MMEIDAAPGDKGPDLDMVDIHGRVGPAAAGSDSGRDDAPGQRTAFVMETR
jgi:hypothetical protein